MAGHLWVSIPSYSGVCCLPKKSNTTTITGAKFQSLLIQGCVVCKWHKNGNLQRQVSFNPFLFRGVLSGIDRWEDKDGNKRFNPFLFRGVLSGSNRYLWRIKEVRFQSLLIQGCVVCERVESYSPFSINRFNPFLFRGVLSGNASEHKLHYLAHVSIPSYSGVCCLEACVVALLGRQTEFQSLLIQGCVVWFDIPAIQHLFPEFQSLLIQGCVVCGKRISLSRKANARFNPFLFRGVLSGCNWSVPRQEQARVSIPSYSGVCCLKVVILVAAVDHWQVSIPSYSGVCCLKTIMNIFNNTQLMFQSLLIQGCVVWYE